MVSGIRRKPEFPDDRPSLGRLERFWQHDRPERSRQPRLLPEPRAIDSGKCEKESNCIILAGVAINDDRAFIKLVFHRLRRMNPEVLTFTSIGFNQIVFSRSCARSNAAFAPSIPGSI